MNLRLEEVEIGVPPEQVYRAWTEEQLLVAWWRNADFHTTRWRGDVSPGGRWEVEFADPQGNTYTAGGSYLSVHSPQRLSFTWEPAWDNDPPTIIELEFRPAATGTALRLTQTGLSGAAAFQRNRHAWSHTVSMLKRFLE